MGTQRPVVIGGEIPEELGGPIAEHHGKKKEKVKKKKIGEKIKEEKFKPQEKVAVVEEKIEKEEKTAEEEKEKKPVPIKKKKVGKAKIRSKKYREVAALIDKQKLSDLPTAIELVKKTSLSKFDGNVEVHIRLLSKTGKPENLRGTLKYPHPTGKKIKVVILDEKLIEEIGKTKKANFDLVLATPAMMAKVGKLAKILGPQGKMPNPKSGTITENPAKTKKELETGMIEYKTDSYGIIHQVLGKVSSDLKVLEENFQALLNCLPKEKISSIHLCSTMGPAVKVLTK